MRIIIVSNARASSKLRRVVLIILIIEDRGGDGNGNGLGRGGSISDHDGGGRRGEIVIEAREGTTIIVESDVESDVCSTLWRDIFRRC
jgi:hypothetical protein